MRPVIERMDHVVVPVPDLEAAARAYERLGLNLTSPTRHTGLGTENRAFFVGASPRQSFYLELLGIRDRSEALAAGRARYVETLDRGGGIARLMLAVSGIASEVDRLQQRGISTAIEEVWTGERKICDVAPLEGIGEMSLAAGLVEYVEGNEAAYERRKAAGRFEQRFPLKRVDHLAAVTPDLEASCRFWSEVLGVPVFGEVRGPGIIIRQLKMGDAVLELLGADGPASRLAGRPAGLSSMVAWQVGDLDEAVALARERGFTPGDPAAGILPGTRVATIPAAELAGVAMQLLEYV
jgi:catechol 2,3-dioxygenase-like lactoylglutathione lyase family enzyme